MNFLATFVAALIPMALGFIWYNPKIFGTAWMEAAEMTEEKMKGANMGKIFGLSFLFAIMLAIITNVLVIHQLHLNSILLNVDGFGEEGSDIQNFITSFMAEHGNNFRTFKHGAFHGVIAGIMIALPILATNSLFERKSGKYIMINAGYWIVCLALMGGIISAWTV